MTSTPEDLDPADRVRHAASFGSTDVAMAYAARPSYPPEAVDWLVRGLGRTRVLDLGAGTGKLTELLVGAGHDVVAVDPSPAMLDPLRARLPSVEALVGDAEDVPLPDASVDLVTVAQAFHWFDPEPALAEIARVLRPGGHLGVVYNVRDERAPAVRAMTEAFGGQRARVGSVAALEGTSLLGAVEEASFPYAQQLDRAGLAALAASRSYVALMAPADRAALLATLDRIFDAYAVGDVLTIPYETRCWRAVRTEGAAPAHGSRP